MNLSQGKLDRQQLMKVQTLGSIAQQGNLTMSQLALDWCLRNLALSSVIIGATKASPIEDNAGATGKKLPAQTLDAIEQILGE